MITEKIRYLHLTVTVNTSPVVVVDRWRLLRFENATVTANFSLTTVAKESTIENQSKFCETACTDSIHIHSWSQSTAFAQDLKFFLFPPVTKVGYILYFHERYSRGYIKVMIAGYKVWL